MRKDAYELVKWAKECGGYVNAHLELRDGGVYTISTVGPGEILFTVALSCCITFQEVITNESIERKHAICCRYLVSERSNGASRWRPYFAILPDTFDTPLYYNDEDIAFLRGTNLYSEIARRRDEWKQEANELDCDYDQFLWAATVLSSRSFPASLFNIPTDQPILVPLVDSQNHRPRTPIEWICSPADFTVKAVKEIETGSEVFNNYGPKSNEELLLGYGFCIAGNPFDFVSLKLGGNVFHLSGSSVPRPVIDEFESASMNSLEKVSGKKTVRSRLAAAEQLQIALKQKLVSICKGPPRSARQKMAQIYRDSQVDILSQCCIWCDKAKLEIAEECVIIGLDDLISGFEYTMEEELGYCQVSSAIEDGMGDTLWLVLLVAHANAATKYTFVIQRLRTGYWANSPSSESVSVAEELNMDANEIYWAMRVLTEEVIKLNGSLSLVSVKNRYFLCDKRNAEPVRNNMRKAKIK